MKISVNLESVFAHTSTAEALSCLHALGYSACERWTFPQAEDDALLALLSQYNMCLSAFCPDFFTLNDPAVQDTYLDALRAACVRANRLGADKLITQVGQDTGAPRVNQHQAIVDGLRAAIPILEQTNMTLLVEPLNSVVDHPGYYLTNAQEGFSIIEEVGSAQVRLLYDVYHMLHMGHDVMADIQAGLPLIGHFHVAGYPRRDERLFQVYDYAPLFAYIDASGTDAYVGIELMPSDPEAGLAVLKELRTYP